MNRRTARGNRWGLGLTGLVLLAVAAYLLLRRYGTVPRLGASHAPVLTSYEREWAAAHDWFWWIAIAVAFVLAVLALRWLLAQSRSDAVRTLPIDHTGPAGDSAVPGRTVLDAAALTDAVQDDVVAIRGVHSATVRLIGSRQSPALRIAVHVTEPGAVARVRNAVREQVTPRARQALDADDLPTYVEVRLDRRATSGARVQ